LLSRSSAELKNEDSHQKQTVPDVGHSNHDIEHGKRTPPQPDITRDNKTKLKVRGSGGKLAQLEAPGCGTGNTHNNPRRNPMADLQQAATSVIKPRNPWAGTRSCANIEVNDDLNIPPLYRTSSGPGISFGL
jgi:hypothetical protein